MGNSYEPSSGATLLGALFPVVRQRVLGVFFSDPTRSVNTNEVIKLVGSGHGAVQRELTALVRSELVMCESVGNQKRYRANPASPLYPELCGLIRKTIGLAAPLRAALAPISAHIHAAFVYGSTAQHTDTAGSDIDLMVVSDKLGYADVFDCLQTAENQLGRPVNPTLLTRAEFSARLDKREAFLTGVLARPKLWIVGSEDGLPDGEPQRPR